MECGNLNVTGPVKLIGSVTIMRCVFIGVGVALGVGFEISYMLKSHSVFISLPVVCGSKM